MEVARETDLPKGPWPVDAYIREAAFMIVARPKDGPVIWTRNGKEYLQAEAFDIARREQPKRDREAEAAKNRAKNAKELR